MFLIFTNPIFYWLNFTHNNHSSSVNPSLKDLHLSEHSTYFYRLSSQYHFYKYTQKHLHTQIHTNGIFRIINTNFLSNFLSFCSWPNCKMCKQIYKKSLSIETKLHLSTKILTAPTLENVDTTTYNNSLFTDSNYEFFSTKFIL